MITALIAAAVVPGIGAVAWWNRANARIDATARPRVDAVDDLSVAAEAERILSGEA